MKHDFNQRREKRIANAQNRAIKNEQVADSLYNSAKDMASHIPMGQPILVGHHSEKRDRNYREKIHNKFGKSFEKREKAAYYADKAKSIESNDAIFSDDPEALQKLREKLKSLEQSQDFMKTANKCVKKRDEESFLKIPHATEKLWQSLTTPGVMGWIGFPPYSLRNNNANIRHVKIRIHELENRQTKQAIDIEINGIRIFENTNANRLQMIFEQKPEAEIRKQLKANGFRWSPTESAWQRHISNTAFCAARQIAENLKN